MRLISRTRTSSSLVSFTADGRALVVRLAGGAVAVIDLASGAERRRLPSVGPGEALALHPGGRLLAVACGAPSPGSVRVLDLDTGAVIWECSGLSSNIVASPVAANGVVYAGSSYDTRALLAIRSNEPAARACGVDVTRHKLRVFAVSAALASVAGSLYGHYLGFVNPLPFGIDRRLGRGPAVR